MSSTPPPAAPSTGPQNPASKPDDAAGGAVVTGAYCTRYAEDISAHGFIRHETSLGNVEYAIASAADEPAVAQLAELFIYDLQKSGELDALLKKYGL